jgi:hypothetical protein
MNLFDIFRTKNYSARIYTRTVIILTRIDHFVIISLGSNKFIDLLKRCRGNWLYYTICTNCPLWPRLLRPCYLPSDYRKNGLTITSKIFKGSIQGIRLYNIPIFFWWVRVAHLLSFLCCVFTFWVRCCSVCPLRFLHENDVNPEEPIT